MQCDRESVRVARQFKLSDFQEILGFKNGLEPICGARWIRGGLVVVVPGDVADVELPEAWV